ncbi:MAG: hypothetical protein V4659_00035 [Pseudomonadota bacterium]
MATAKPLASLSSGLLARPGQAKPAMRPQVFNYAPVEDLGWNDMGHAEPAPVPPVLIERARLDVVAPPPQPIKPTPAPVSHGHKAAFTLRLDADRHLRLRLASAVVGRSSQQLLVAALDAFLDSQPQVEALARQIPAKPIVSGEK